MQVPGFVVAVAVLSGILWTSYFHTLWYGSRLEVVGGYSCTDEVIHYGQYELPEPCPREKEAKQQSKTSLDADNEHNWTERSGHLEQADEEDVYPDPEPEPTSQPEKPDQEPSTLERLAPAITECFVVILCGYLAGRINLISPAEVKGLNKFVGNFVLPALIFLSMAKLNFSDVNWGFLLILYGAKAIVFVLVAMATAAASYPSNFGRAGLYAIFSTQSNDFALGYPLVQALYSRTHPDFASYLYLAAPSSLIMLNPIGFLMMELQRARSGAGGAGAPTKRTAGWWSTGQRVLTGIGTNPVVFMTFLGIIANRVFDHCLPNILEGILRVLGQAFSSSALFMLGLQMVGKVKSMRGPAMLVPVILITIKCFLLPLIIRGMLVHFPPSHTDATDFQEFGFLIGTFPTAPGVFVFATQYSIDVDMLSSALVACTFLATPFMLLSARMASLRAVNVSHYVTALRGFVFYTTAVSAATVSCVILVLLITRKYRRVPYPTTISLLSAQLLAAVGALLWYSLDSTVTWQVYLKYVWFTYGQFASRVWAALLAVTLTLVSRYPVGVVKRLRTVTILVGWGIPLILTLGIFAGAKYEGKDIMESMTSPGHLNVVPVYVQTNPNMGFGYPQIYTNFGVQFITLIVVVVCLVLHQRFKHEYVTYVTLEDDPGSNPAPLRSRAVSISDCTSVVSFSPDRDADDASAADSELASSAQDANQSEAGSSDATSQRPRRPRPLLKTKSQIEVEKAYLDEARRKLSEPAISSSKKEEINLLKKRRSKSTTEKKGGAQDQLTYSYATTPKTDGNNWKMPPANSGPEQLQEQTFSVKKLKKRESELSVGTVIRCDATGCQIRKKITPPVQFAPTANEMICESPMMLGDVAGEGDDSVSISSHRTDFSGFSCSTTTSSTASFFHSRAPSVTASLYNPEMPAVEGIHAGDQMTEKLGCGSVDESSVLRDRDEEFHTLRHTLLLVSLAWSMTVSLFLCGCSLSLQNLGRMGGVYIQLTFIDTIINFGQGVLAFFVLGLDPEAIMVLLRSRWMRLRYGDWSLGFGCCRGSRRKQDDTNLICSKFVDFYLERCIQEIVRDRRVQQKLLRDVFLGKELVDWLLVQGLANSRSAAVRYGKKLQAGGVIEHHDHTYNFCDMPFWYQLTEQYREVPEPATPAITTQPHTVLSVD